MKHETREKRRREIEKAAYELIEEKGFLGISMLMIAKRAKASNETLYRWYGDKVGLFKAMVQSNAAEVKQQLLNDIETDGPALDAIKLLGPTLLKLLLSDRAIALNCAAASDASGELGKALAKGGREDVLPHIAKLFERAQQDGYFKSFDLPELCSLYLDLLIGDQQVRRAIGVLTEPSQFEIDRRSKLACERLMRFS